MSRKDVVSKVQLMAPCFLAKSYAPRAPCSDNNRTISRCPLRSAN